MLDKKQQPPPPLKSNIDLLELDERQEKKLSRALYNLDLETIKEIVTLYNISAYKKNDGNILINLLTNLTGNLYDIIVREAFHKNQAGEALCKEVLAIPDKLLTKLIPSLTNQYQFIRLIVSGSIEDMLNQNVITHEQEVSLEIRQTLFKFIKFCRDQYETNIALVSQVIEAILKQGVSINAFCGRSPFVCNPLTTLFANGHIDMTLLRLLLSNNADVLAKNSPAGPTVLETSTSYAGAFDMFNLFIEMGKLKIDKIPKTDYDSVKAALIKNLHQDDARNIYEVLVAGRHDRKPLSLYWQCVSKLASFDHKQLTASLEYKQVKRFNQAPTLGVITPTTLGVLVDPTAQDKLTVYWVDGNGKLNQEVSVAPEIAAAILEVDETSNDTALINGICRKFGCSKKIPEEAERAIEDVRPLQGYP